MARYFLDSSALVKRYHSESGSPIVNALFQESANRIVISRLALIEVHSALARLVREKVLSESEFIDLTGNLKEDVANGTLIVVALSSQILDEGSAILSSFGLKNQLRTLDAIHLATVFVLQKRTIIEAFVAADKRLLASADANAVAVLDVG